MRSSRLPAVKTLAAESGRRVYYGTLNDLVSSLKEAQTSGSLAHPRAFLVRLAAASSAETGARAARAPGRPGCVRWSAGNSPGGFERVLKHQTAATRQTAPAMTPRNACAVLLRSCVPAWAPDP